ncbi:MAG: nucleoside deaminase [Firmicutes bacterium]|nr:nucleoside deaminase [Bacillota bacterium]
MPEHEFFMLEAYCEALRALAIDDVPIGCVIAQNGEIVARGYNRRNAEKNTLRHAELIAIDRACQSLGDWRLEGCAIYVTVEPCPMCAGAILQARMSLLVYGAENPKAGCAGSVCNLPQTPGFNHKVEIVGGVLKDECAALMKEYFRRFRAGND